jgi:hypothetical protein
MLVTTRYDIARACGRGHGAAVRRETGRTNWNMANTTVAASDDAISSPRQTHPTIRQLRGA